MGSYKSRIWTLYKDSSITLYISTKPSISKSNYIWEITANNSSELIINPADSDYIEDYYYLGIYTKHEGQISFGISVKIKDPSINIDICSTFNSYRRGKRIHFKK